MRNVVIIDSMSNIPQHVLDTRSNIKVIPLNTQIGGEVGLDSLQTKQLRQFYTENPLKTDPKADATSPTPEQISVFLLNEIVPHYDCAIFQSTSALLSDVYKCAEQCSTEIEQESRVVRKMAGISEPFRYICTNSGNSSSGQTLLAIYTDALLKKGVNPDTAVQNADRFKNHVKTFSVISDIMQARTRMKSVGHKTISMPSAVSGQIQRNAPLVSLCNDRYEIKSLKIGYKQAIKSLFNYAERCIESGLHLPIIHVAYAGIDKKLHGMDEFKSLKKVADKYGVVVISSMMSVSACINYSTASISLGIVPKNDQIEPI